MIHMMLKYSFKLNSCIRSDALELVETKTSVCGRNEGLILLEITHFYCFLLFFCVYMPACKYKAFHEIIRSMAWSNTILVWTHALDWIIWSWFRRKNLSAVDMWAWDYSRLLIFIVFHFFFMFTCQFVI